MLVQMLTRSAHPVRKCHAPGDVVDIPDAEARQMIVGGYAVAGRQVSTVDPKTGQTVLKFIEEPLPEAIRREQEAEQERRRKEMEAENDAGKLRAENEALKKQLAELQKQGE